MTKYIATIESADGEKVEWRMHDRFDPESVTDEYNPEEIGGNDAVSVNLKNENIDKNNLTPSERKVLEPVSDYFSQLNEAVSRIVGVVIKHAGSLLHGKSNNISEGNGTSELEEKINNFENTWKVKFDECKRNYKDKLEQLTYDRELSERGVRKFRKDNKLHREASYPDSHIMHVAWIMVALVGESFGNTYFYAQASDLGLVGGWLSAFLVSAANVAVSFMIGIVFLRYIHHVDIIKKFLGGLGLIIGLFALGLLHLGAAHFRELLMIDPENAQFKVISSVVNDPFGINDLDSLILILLGVSISMLVIRKGYTYDDAYPGYGKIQRDCVSVTAKWRSIDNHFREEIGKILNQAKSQIRQIKEEIGRVKSEFKKLEHDFKPYSENVITNIEAATDDAVNFCMLYRKGYNDVVGKNVFPTQKDSLKDLVKKYFDLSDFDTILEKSEKKINEGSSRLETWSSNIISALTSNYNNIEKDFTSLVSEENEEDDRKKAEENAKKRINKLTEDSSD